MGLLTVIGHGLLFFVTRAFFRNVREIKHLLIAARSGNDCFCLRAHSSGWLRSVFVGRLFHRGSIQSAVQHLWASELSCGDLAMAGPIALEFARAAAAAKHWRSLGLAALVAGLSVAAVIASLSRAAWLALAVTWVALAIAWYLAGKRCALLAISFVPMILVAGVLLLGPSELRNSLGQRVQQLDELGSRRFLWAAGWQMFLDHPIVGHGLDTFQLAFAAKRTPEYWAVEWNATPARRSNEFIQILATQGLLGGIATVGLLIGIAVAISRSWNRAETADRGRSPRSPLPSSGSSRKAPLASPWSGVGPCSLR